MKTIPKNKKQIIVPEIEVNIVKSSARKLRIGTAIVAIFAKASFSKREVDFGRYLMAPLISMDFAKVRK